MPATVIFFAMRKILLPVLLLGSFATKLLADDPTALDTRYGWFNGLDHRSSYGQGVCQSPSQFTGRLFIRFDALTFEQFQNLAGRSTSTFPNGQGTNDSFPCPWVIR